MAYPLVYAITIFESVGKTIESACRFWVRNLVYGNQSCHDWRALEHALEYPSNYIFHVSDKRIKRNYVLQPGDVFKLYKVE